MPVTKSTGDEIYSGSTCKQGEIEAVVIATGVHTFFGKAAHLVDSTNQVGHFQQVSCGPDPVSLNQGTLAVFQWEVSGRFSLFLHVSQVCRRHDYRTSCYHTELMFSMLITEPM